MAGVDPYKDDDKPAPSEWDDDEEMPYDSNGRQYNPYAGSQSPSEGRCNAVLTNYEERYGEKRYCTAMPEKTFVEDGSDRCKNHTNRDALMKNSKELMKHGAFCKNYALLFDKLEPWEQIEAIQTFRDLLSDSVYDFETEDVEWEFDVSETKAPFDEFEVTIPVPQTKRYAAKSLWTAALDYAKQDRINWIQFDEGMEKTFVIGVNENDEPIEAEDEHHLHITSSRVTGDIKKKLEMGGVGVDEEEASGGGKNEFIQVVASPDDLAPPEPEATAGEKSLPLNDLELEDDDE